MNNSFDKIPKKPYHNFRNDSGIVEHDKLFPKREIDTQFEKIVYDNELSTIEAISFTSRLITRLKPIDIYEFKSLIEYIELRIEMGEFGKALYYAYTAFVDSEKDPENIEKQELRNKIFDLITECSQKLKK